MLRRTSSTRLAFLLMMLTMTGCTPGLASPENPTVVPASETASLPDLIIKRMYLEMDGRQATCVVAFSSYGIRVLIENIGSGSAGPFVVDLLGAQQQVDEGLAAGQSILLHFPGTVPSGQYEAYADATDRVVELREDNNSLSYLAPTPTPPLLCTSTPSATP